MNILIATLGQTWKVIAEAVAFAAPEQYPIFRQQKDICLLQHENDLTSIDSLFLVSTDNDTVTRGLQCGLIPWLNRSKTSVPDLKIFTPVDICDVDSAYAIEGLRELIYSVVGYSKEITNSRSKSRLYVCLAGGRKSMSADLQMAATYFGCDLLYHVLKAEGGKRKEPQADKYELTELEVQQLLITLIGKEISPMGDSRDLATRAYAKIEKSLLVNGCNSHESYKIPELKANISKEISNQMRAGLNFVSNIYTTSYRDRDSDNFTGLLALSPQFLELLRTTKIGITSARQESEIKFISMLPKADLHCHLGGALSCSEMVAISSYLEEDIFEFKRKDQRFSDWVDVVSKISLSNFDECIEIISSLRNLFRDMAILNIHLYTAVLLKAFRDHEEILDNILFGNFVNEGKFRGIKDANRYFRLGDLQGSGLLQSRSAIFKAVSFLCEKSINDRVLYLEIRCSPQNYTRGGLDAFEAYRAIVDAVDTYKHSIEVRIIFILTRYKDPKNIENGLQLLSKILNNDNGIYKKYLVGVDLAGFEDDSGLKEFRESLLPVMEKCIHITIHAGETAQADNIWDAIYHLNAERIGHGLSLDGNSELLERVKDRGITVEMCPSSNDQIIGFRDNYYDDSRESFAIYPLKQYLDSHIRATVNSDNLGISRTNLTKELHKACRLTPTGLDVMSLMQLIKNSFSGSFAPYELRRGLVLEAERLVGKVLGDAGIGLLRQP